MTHHRTTTTVKLSYPLTVGGAEVKQVVLHRPTPGELRGLMLTHVLQMEFNTMMRLIPRVSEPSLDEGTICGLNVIDFIKIATALVLLFAPDDEREALRRDNYAQIPGTDHASQ